MEGYSECLAMECAPFGVRVCLVEPGDHRGGASRYRLRGGRADSPYAAALGRATDVMRHDEETGSDPARLGRLVAKALQKKRLPAYLRVAKADQHLAVLLHKILPARLFRGIISSYYKVG